MRTIVIIIILTNIMLGCKNNKKNKSYSKETEQQTTFEKKANNSKEILLVINSDDNMMFDKSELRVKAGQKVTLTLNHTGKMAKKVMGHNWVLLKKGTKITDFANKAIVAKDNDYITEKHSIIAYTKLIGGGESTTITFTAPKKGTYNYICSFPGHSSMMRGVLIVE